MADTTEKLLFEAKNSADWLIRRRCLIQLSHHRDKSLFEFFQEALLDPVSEVRHAAIIALSRLGDGRAVQDLAKPKFLQSDDVNVRWATVKALGVLGDILVLDKLVPLVDDEEWLVRNEVISILTDKAGEIVERRDPALARILLRMLSISDPGIIKIASEGLVSIAPACSNLLIDALKNVKEKVRYHAALILGQAKEIRAMPQLTLALRDSSAIVRKAAVIALGKIGDKNALLPLIESMYDRNDHVRAAVIEALETFGTDILEPLHSELIHTRDKDVMAATVTVLGSVTESKSIPELVDLLSSSYHTVRHATVLALTKFGIKCVPFLLEHLRPQTTNLDILIQEASNADNMTQKLRTIKALGDLEDYRATVILKSMLKDQNSDVVFAAQEALVKIGCAAWGRCGALQIFGNIGDRSVIPQIIEALTDHSPHVRFEAIRAIGKLKGAEAMAQLTSLAKNDPVHEIRSESLKVLREIAQGRKELYKTALDATRDTVSSVRLEAVRILGDKIDETAFESLLSLLSDTSWNVRLNAENAICNYGIKITPKLLDRLRLENFEGRCRIVSALARIGDNSAIAPLEQLLAQEEVDPRMAIIVKKALMMLKGETGQKSAYQALPLC